MSDPTVEKKERSDGSSANYYDLPRGAASVEDLICHRNMNYGFGTLFKMVAEYTGAEEHWPANPTKLQDLISYYDLNAQMGEIFRALYRLGLVEHSEELRDAKKIKFYLDAELERLQKYEDHHFDKLYEVDIMIEIIDSEIDRLTK